MAALAPMSSIRVELIFGSILTSWYASSSFFQLFLSNGDWAAEYELVEEERGWRRKKWVVEVVFVVSEQAVGRSMNEANELPTEGSDFKSQTRVSEIHSAAAALVFIITISLGNSDERLREQI